MPHKKASSPVSSYREAFLEPDDDYSDYLITLTWYVDMDAIISVTLARPTAEEARQAAKEAMHDAQKRLRKGYLLLPHMGDFLIEYFSPTRT